MRPQTTQAKHSRTLTKLWHNPAGKIGIIVATLILSTAIISWFWTPYPIHLTDIANRWAPPSLSHLLGTDATGRDIASLLMAGAQTAVIVMICSGIIATIIGGALALLGALSPTWMRESVAVLVDVLIAFPTLLIAMMISAVWGGSLTVVIIAVGIGFGVNIARVTRAEIRRYLFSDVMLAGRASGLTPSQNLRHHLLPHIYPIFIVQLSWAMAVSVLAEAGLSYLGFGAPITDASWGVLLSDVQAYITVHPLSALWPGLVIMITVLGMNLLGDGLREVSDPSINAKRGSARKARTHVPEVIA